MPKQEEDYKAYMDQHMKNWRAWGSWFSWGSPVGLGLFFLEISAAIWVLSRVFHQ